MLQWSVTASLTSPCHTVTQHLPAAGWTHCLQRQVENFPAGMGPHNLHSFPLPVPEFQVCSWPSPTASGNYTCEMIFQILQPMAHLTTRQWWHNQIYESPWVMQCWQKCWYNLLSSQHFNISYFGYQMFCCAKIRVLISVKLPTNILHVSYAMECYNFPKSGASTLT